MVKVIVLSLLLGIGAGYFIIDREQVEIFSRISDFALVILMFSVGISVGTNKEVFEKIKEYHLRIMIIPFGVIVGTLVGGALVAILFNMPVNEGLAVVSGMGWYSLAGVLITDLAGAELGTIAFLSSFMREVIAFMIIPTVASKFNYYTAIAPAAATSEDTTLPILVKYTSEEIVVMAVINGVMCSLLVPILIHLFL